MLNGCGVQAVANTCTLLDCLPIIEPNPGGYPVRVAHKSADRVASTLLPKSENFLLSQGWFQVHRGVNDEVRGDD